MTATMVRGGWVNQLHGQGDVVRKRRGRAAPSDCGTIAEEFAVQKYLFTEGLAVAEPIALDEAEFTMRRIEGESDPVLTEDQAVEITRAVGEFMARLHGLAWQRSGIAFRRFPLAARWESAHSALDALPGHYPILEWAIQKLRAEAPVEDRLALCHRDLRFGNCLVSPDKARLVAVLDWEMAGIADPYEDLGWYCARCWRGSNSTLEAAGLAPRQVLLDGYAAISRIVIDMDRLLFWERYALLRWAIIALQQGERYRHGAGGRLGLAMTPLRALEAAYDLLMDYA
ncbi:MAG TPA: phosphotransferase family protein [Dongiaceae bacterium]|nr:phosphotransferase family protein [Dongiaceae bacterium]